LSLGRLGKRGENVRKGHRILKATEKLEERGGKTRKVTFFKGEGVRFPKDSTGNRSQAGKKKRKSQKNSKLNSIIGER